MRHQLSQKFYRFGSKICFSCSPCGLVKTSSSIVVACSVIVQFLVMDRKLPHCERRIVVRFRSAQLRLLI
ncbi:hypothetical protein DMI69_02450 [Escherichia coli]|nr:hypothetical protein [Escherichia coli]